MQLPSSILPLQVFVIVAYAQSSYLIRDYFVYKKVTRVVGFSCGNMEDDFFTMKLMNAVGISTAIKPAGFKVNILRYLHTERTLGVFLDIRCPNHDVSDIFDESTAHRMFDYSYNWLLLGTNISHSAQSLNDSGFCIVTDFVIALPNESDYVLYDVYNHYKLRGGILNITELGTWRKDDGLAITLNGTKIARRGNFHGMRAKAAGTVVRRPKEIPLIEYLEGDGYEIMDNWPKFGHAMLSHLSNMFNFTMDLIELTHWEKNDSNGPLVGALKRDEADLGYYPSILTIARYADARVIFQQWPTRTCFMFRTIPAMKMKPWVILKPFASDTWYSILVLVVIIVFIMSFILKLERAEDYSCSITALITVAALSQQGFPSVTEKSAGRIAFIQIMVFGLLVYNYYSAAIVSARLNEPLQKMNDSLYSLANSKMKLAAEENIFFDFLLRNTRSEVQYFKHFWDAIPESKRFIPIEEGVRRMMKGGFAYHADPDDIYRTIDQMFDKQMICQLTEVHLLRPSELGLWCNRKSHFHEIAKIGLLKISTTGLRRREIRRRMARRPYCPSEEIFVSSVTIYEAAPILIFLVFGMIVSLIVFSIENLIFYLMHSKQAAGVIPRKKNKVLLNHKVMHKNNAVLPKANTLFRDVPITKRHIAMKF